MDQEKYLFERVDDQINWLEKKAAFNQLRFNRVRLIQLLCSACVPFLVAMISGGDGPIKWAAGALSVVITICEGILALYKYQELRLQYRNTAETLRKEKLLFLAGAEKYENQDSAFKLFVVEAEAILAQDNAQWRSQIEKVDKPK